MAEESDSENDFESADEGDESQPTSTPIVDNPQVNDKIEGDKTEESHVEAVKCDAPCENQLNTSEPKPKTENKVEVTNIVETVGDDSLEELPAQSSIQGKCSKEAETNIKIIPASVEPTSNQNSKMGKCNQEVHKVEKVLLLKEKRELERLSKLEQSTTVRKETKSSTQQQEEKSSPGWGFVGGWSSSFISSFASSASTFTTHVTQGIGTVLETVEATLGAPSPEELAAQRKTEKQLSVPECPDNAATNSMQEKPAYTPVGHVPDSGHSVGGLFGGVSAITRALETTGSKVITGGLDTLELIGKKTMDILTEGDPGLRKKRNLFGGSATTLSQVLRDAKNRSEEETSAFSDDSSDEKHISYSKLFDDYQGLVHLEALEILSRRCKSKLDEQLFLMGSETEPLRTVLQELHATCLNLPPTDDTPDEEATQDFEKLVDGHISALPLNLNIEKIKTAQSETRAWITLCKSEQDAGTRRDANEIYSKIITSLAELTARAMELFHKMAELLLVTGSDLGDLQSFAEHFTGLTGILCTEVGILTSQFCHCLSTAADDSEDPDAVNPLITNVYLEASNSNTYIQDAFQLLIPIFQEIAARS